MTEKEFTPEQQLKWIEEMVFEARLRIEENGFAFILWGITIALASFTQAYLIHIEQYSVSWYPYLAMPLVGLFTYGYYAKKAKQEKQEKNPIDFIYSRVWIFISLNIMLLAFIFNGVLQENLVALILILIGVATLISGSIIRSKIVLFSGLALHLGGYWAFFLPWEQQPILMGGLGLLAVLLPGIVLSIQHNKQHV